MVQTFQTWYTSTIALPVWPTDTTITVAVAPTVTKGRMKIGRGTVKERISYTWVSWLTLTGVTRWLSLTADPATAGTGLSWLAGTQIKLVAMHDQLTDKKEDNSFSWNITSTWTLTATDIRFTGTTTSWLRIKTLTTTQRDALTPATGDKIINSTTGTEQTYYGGTWNDAWTSTTPNMSTSITGKWRLADQTQVNNGDATEAWDPLVVWPAELKTVTDAISASIPVITNYFGFASDWNVTISTDTTLTRDMFYGNLTINNWVTLYPNWYKIFCSWTLLNNGTISRVGNTGGAWGAWSWGNVPWSAWAAANILNQWTLNDQTASAAWWASWAAWGNWTSVSPAYTNTSWVSWWAWGTWWSAWGTWGTATQWSLYNTIFSRDQIIALLQSAALSLSWFYATTSYKVCWTAGWWGCWTSAWGIWWGWGWGWWWHGWLIYIAANIFNNQWTVNCSWWAGGAWGSWGAWWGWGWGWNWWVLFLIRKTLTNLWTVNVSWGTGWAGGWSGSWFPWSSWSTGNSWTTIQITV